MKSLRRFVIVLFMLALTGLACNLSAPTRVEPSVEGLASAEASLTPAAATPEAVPTEAGPTVAPTAPLPLAPTATTAKLQLEVVQSQTWTDRDENTRVNFLLRNPYDFPVAPRITGHTSLLNGAGEFMRSADLYFLDGISGGIGFILPGETIAATACFTCERAALSEAWGSVKFDTAIADASDKWKFSRDVEAVIGNVTFKGDRPIFQVTGTVTNKSDGALGRISARIFVYDQDGNLVGASEVSSWDVPKGASVNFRGYGIGKKPDGPLRIEITVLGVNY